jgi:outer membrane protein assembly factor BamB
MEKTYSQIFEMKSGVLCFDGDKSVLLYKKSGSGTGKWIKKINEINRIEPIIEDGDRYYLACQAGEIEGYLLAINKQNGETEWFIPGRSYFQLLYGGHLYAIFADEERNFYLIKVDQTNGKKIWHHRVDQDLCEYGFRPDRILLTYESGKIEKISPTTGRDTPNA